MAAELHTSMSPPRFRRRTLGADFVGILIPLGILAIGAGVLVYSIVNRPVQETTPEVKAIPKVQTVVAVPYRNDLVIDVDGVVVPHREIQLPTEVSGRIIRRAEHCRAGKFVKAGETLVEIDPLDYELEVKRLQQERTQAELKIAETKVDIANTKQLIELSEQDLRLQEKDVRRMSQLSSKQAVSQTEVDRSLREQVTASNALQNLRNRENLLNAQLNSAKMELELSATKIEVAKLNLERTKIESPIDGIVVEENSEVDSYVQKGSTVVTIEDTSAVEVLCNLRQDQIAWLWKANIASPNTNIGSNFELPPAPATVGFKSDGHEYIWKGVVSRYNGQGIDVRTRTVPCRILVPNPTEMTLCSDATSFSPEEPLDGQASGQTSTAGGPGALSRGMFVNVQIQVPSTSDTELLSVPINAIRPGSKLWVVENNQLQIRSANVAKTLEDHVLIRRDGTNIELDDRIIVSPLPAATAGMTVEEIPAS